MKVEMERLELLNSQNDTRKFYKALNNARKPFKPRVTLCKDKVGDIISDKQGILARWVRNFDKLLNGDPAAKETSNEGSKEMYRSLRGRGDRSTHT
jgi:2'-5' RNA ligase